MKRGGLSEYEIIKLFQKLPYPPSSSLPSGDDAWSFYIDESKKYMILSIDMLVSSTDVPPSMSLRQASRKAIVMTVSDLASKGASPHAFLLSIGLDRPERGIVKEIIAGVEDALQEYGGYIAGGDVNRTAELIIDVAGLGFSSSPPLPRDLGDVGDFVCVTGPFGYTYIGLKLLLNKIKLTSVDTTPFVDAVLLPKARLKEGLLLASSNLLKGMTDSSDGLVASLYNMSQKSGKGVILETLPLPELVEVACRELNISPIDAVCYGGEEYELIFVVAKDYWEEFRRYCESHKIRVLKIGYVVDTPGVWFKYQEKVRKLPFRGWQHFT